MRLFTVIQFPDRIKHALSNIQRDMQSVGIFFSSYNHAEKGIRYPGFKIPEKIYVPDEGMNVTRISLIRSERGKHGMICSETGYIGSDD